MERQPGTAAGPRQRPFALFGGRCHQRDAGAIGTRRRHAASGRAHVCWVKSPQHAVRDSVLAAVRGLKAVGSAIQLASAADASSTELSSAAICVSKLVLGVDATVVMCSFC